MQTVRLLLLCSFFFTSLLWPSASGSLFRVDDGLLSVLFALSLPTGLRSSVDKRYLAATIAFVVVFLTVGMAGALLVPLAPGFSSGGAGTIKEVGRLVKLGMMCYASLAVLRTLTPGQRTAAGGVFALLLGIHLAVGIAQYAQVPYVADLTQKYFVDEVQASNLTEGAVEQHVFRAVGTVYNPNIYGFIGLTMGFVVRSLVPEKRRFGILVAAATAATVVLSQSRSAIVAGLLGIASFGLAPKSGRGVLGRWLTLGIVGAALFLGRSFLAEGRLSGDASTLLDSRPQYAWLFDSVLSRSPVLGFGTGAQWDLPSDSDYLFALIQAGLLGVLALAAYYYLLFFGVGKRLPGLRAAVVVAAVGGIANGVFFGNEITPFVYMMFASAITELRLGGGVRELSLADMPTSPMSKTGARTFR